MAILTLGDNQAWYWILINLLDNMMTMNFPSLKLKGELIIWTYVNPRVI